MGKVSSNPHHWWLDLFGCVGMQQRKLFTKNFFTLFRKELLCLTALPPVKRKKKHSLVEILSERVNIIQKREHIVRSTTCMIMFTYANIVADDMQRLACSKSSHPSDVCRSGERSQETNQLLLLVRKWSGMYQQISSEVKESVVNGWLRNSGVELSVGPYCKAEFSSRGM